MSDSGSPAAPDGSPPPMPSAPMSGSPSEFLKAVVGKRVVVRLVSGVDYRGKLFIPLIFIASNSALLKRSDSFNSMTGILQCLDGYMNIAMEQTEEYVNGVVTNRYGDAFIRGNNGKSVISSD
jgi:U6 snRNA-associated Sm-like protein LSm6